MATTVTELELLITANTAQINAQVKALQSEVATLSQKAEQGSFSFGKMFGTMTLSSVALSGFNHVKEFLSDSIERGVKVIESNHQMKTAFEQAGLGGDALARQIASTNSLIGELTPKLGLSGGTIRETAGQVAFLTGATGEMNSKMTTVALTVEKFTKGAIDSTMVIRALGKDVNDPATAEGIGRLNRAYPALASALRGITDPAQKVDAALKFLQPTMRGIEERMQTPIGQLEMMELRFNKVKAAAGVELVKGLSNAYTAFASLGDALKSTAEHQLDQAKAAEEAARSNKEGIENAIKERENTIALIREYETLGNKKSRTAQETSRFNEISGILQAHYPDMINSTMTYKDTLAALEGVVKSTAGEIDNMRASLEGATRSEQDAIRGRISASVNLAAHEADKAWKNIMQKAMASRNQVKLLRDETEAEWKRRIHITGAAGPRPAKAGELIPSFISGTNELNWQRKLANDLMRAANESQLAMAQESGRMFAHHFVETEQVRNEDYLAWLEYWNSLVKLQHEKMVSMGVIQVQETKTAIQNVKAETKKEEKKSAPSYLAGSFGELDAQLREMENRVMNYTDRNSAGFRSLYDELIIFREYVRQVKADLEESGTKQMGGRETLIGGVNSQLDMMNIGLELSISLIAQFRAEMEKTAFISGLMANALNGIADSFGAMATGKADAWKQGLKVLLDAALQYAEKKLVVADLVSLIEALFNPASVITNVPLRIAAHFALQAARAAVNSFAVGAWNIPYDQLAMIHAGEMIIPKAAADKLRAPAQGGAGQTNAQFPEGYVQMGDTRKARANVIRAQFSVTDSSFAMGYKRAEYNEGAMAI